MSVFLSYAHEDEAMALLLSYILNDKGIDCLIDQRLAGGERLEGSIQSMIKKCEVFLVLLTQSSIKSAWVNQEIGYAAGCGKMIWPLAVHRDIKPEGMVESMTSYSLFNWSSASETVNKLVAALEIAFDKANLVDFQNVLGLEHIIHGKLERRHFMNSRLHDLLVTKKPIELYMQAAFSLFAGSQQGEHDGQSSEEIEIGMLQKKLLIQLVEQPTTQLKLIIWPYRDYSKKQLQSRYINLLDWMNGSLSNKNIEFLCADYEGANKFVVKNNFSIEGYKKHPTTGYDYTIAKYDQTFLDDTIEEFMQIFDDAKNKGETKQTAIDTVKNLLEKL